MINRYASIPQLDEYNVQIMFGFIILLLSVSYLCFYYSLFLLV